MASISEAATAAPNLRRARRNDGRAGPLSRRARLLAREHTDNLRNLLDIQEKIYPTSTILNAGWPGWLGWRRGA